MTRAPAGVIRTVVADDHAQFRHGLRVALEAEGAHIEVVGEASNGREAIDLVAELDPDVVILDIRMPGTSGISAAREIASAAPDTHILMLTVSDEPDDIAQAMRAGATGYLLKERSLEEIADAVVALADGRSWPAATA
jgi:DNA-binding NarL/FixJ family response regulator